MPRSQQQPQSQSLDEAFTLVNVFSVEPARQAELAARVLHTAQTVAAALPGFIDATVLSSIDGTRVVNYARWADQDAFKLFLAAAPSEMAEASSLGQPDGHAYRVAGRAPADHESGVR